MRGPQSTGGGDGLGATTHTEQGFGHSVCMEPAVHKWPEKSAALVALSRARHTHGGQWLSRRVCGVRQSAGGWQKFAAGWTVGGLAGVAWAYILTQTLPYYF